MRTAPVLDGGKTPGLREFREILPPTASLHPVRGKGDSRHSFRLDPHSPQSRTHDDVLAAHYSSRQ
jgi:hypothetical protein